MISRPTRRRLLATALPTLALIATLTPAAANPVDLVLEPSPQVTGQTCQSYALGLALAFHPASPIKAGTASELREAERRIRAALLKSAGGAEPVRKDWKAAVEAVTNSALTAVTQEFASLDEALRFAAQKTGIAQADRLPAALSAAMVKTPVLMSMTRVGASRFSSGHIVTIIGVALPPASIADTAKPALLFVNSAVKYPGGIKNICAEEDLSDADRYRATVSLTSDYDLKRFAPKPYLVTFIAVP